jgi:hypothetical protein
MARISERNSGCGWVLAAIVILCVLFRVLLPPFPNGIHDVFANMAMQSARSINLLCFEYSTDHDGHYPDGRSSTDVFQHLIDEKYCSDPTIFYLPLRGKTKALPGETLKPENVCFDVTSDVDADSPNGLPVVFITGYRIDYVANAKAVPLIKPWPPYGESPWVQWWTGHNPPSPGMGIAYKSNSATYLKLGPDGNVSNVIRPDFDAKGRIYRQLTPDGVLP